MNLQNVIVHLNVDENSNSGWMSNWNKYAEIHHTSNHTNCTAAQQITHTERGTPTHCSICKAEINAILWGKTKIDGHFWLTTHHAPLLLPHTTNSQLCSQPHSNWCSMRCIGRPTLLGCVYRWSISWRLFRSVLSFHLLSLQREISTSPIYKHGNQDFTKSQLCRDGKMIVVVCCCCLSGPTFHFSF